MSEAQDSGSVSTKLSRIAQIARERPELAFTSLAHHIDIEFMREAFRRIRKGGAVGVDGQTAAEYETELNKNLESLLERFKAGTYRAPPVRRVYIPKASGKLRPIGIPTLEDKVLQRAVLMLLEAIYEEDFHDCSYGFRPNRSAHRALATTRELLMKTNGGWIIEADLQSFFDTIDHQHLRSFLDRRLRDGVVRRQIDRWLSAGVLEDGAISRSELGSPQGGVISPLLANIFLHEVLDTWWQNEVKPRLRGSGELVRYADDYVLLFAREDDARRVLEVLPKRVERFALKLHPEKTRLIDFRSPARKPQGTGEGDQKQTFDLLGFTHYWGRTRRGWWVVKHSTARSRFTRAVKAMNEWCRSARHLPIPEQQKTLSQKLRGHFAYYGISGNARAIGRFQRETLRIWRKWLGRRSFKARVTWQRFWELMKFHPLPPPRIVHNLKTFAANP